MAWGACVHSHAVLQRPLGLLGVTPAPPIMTASLHPAAHAQSGHMMVPIAVCHNREMASHPAMVVGRSVLEIGAGCGACGILAAKLGAQRVLLTDYVDAVLCNLRDCMHLNSGSGDGLQEKAEATAVAAALNGTMAVADGAAAAASGAAAAAAAAAAATQAEAPPDEEEWDPEDASECGSEEFEALLGEGLGGSAQPRPGSSGSSSATVCLLGPQHLQPQPQQQRGTAASWDAAPMHVRYYDWQDSVAHVGEQARAMLAATAAASGATSGSSIDRASNESGAPGMDGEEQFDCIIGTDTCYEW